jgi:hypothetical protein
VDSAVVEIVIMAALLILLASCWLKAVSILDKENINPKN